jgi:hypothetical protein
MIGSTAFPGRSLAGQIRANQTAVVCGAASLERVAVQEWRGRRRSGLVSSIPLAQLDDSFRADRTTGKVMVLSLEE